MRIPLVLILIMFAIISKTDAQTYGNEWINHSQKYYKIKISKTGIYKISYQDLSNSGVLGNNIDPRNIQLFKNGIEIPIYVKGENDGVFNPSDYIYFYAEKNTGWLDSAIYDHPIDQSNPYYSLINDTSAVFLTWNNSSNNERYTEVIDTNYSTSPTIPYCIKETITNYTSSYYSGRTSARLTSGEGWFDSFYSIGGYKIKNISTQKAYTTGINTDIEFGLIGVSNANSIYSYNHHLSVDINSLNVYDTTFMGYSNIKKHLSISSSSLSPNISIRFSCIDDLNISADKQSISFIKIRYPHTFDFENTNFFKFDILNQSSSKSLLNITNFDYTNEVFCFDLIENKLIKANTTNDIRIIIENIGTTKKCVLVSDKGIIDIANIKKIEFIDYSIVGFNSDYIIITNKALESSAILYKNYRANSFNPEIVYIDELYNQFAFGINKHPIAIKNFVNYITNTYDSIPKNLFILGKSIHANLFRKDTANYKECLVPSTGNPSSDILLTSNLNGNGYEPAIPTGRLAAINNNEVIQYLSKVTDFENNTPASWMKNILHFGGGYTVSEQLSFQSYLNSYKNIIEDTLFGGYVSTFLKTSSVPMQISQSDSVRNLINNGASMLTFFGHGSTSGFDQNTDVPSAYTNYQKYPLILANSCLAGDIHLPRPRKISEDWVLIENKGAIAFLASVDLGEAGHLNDFSTRFHKQLAYKNYGKGIGLQVQQTMLDYLSLAPANENIINTCIEYTLHGDPAIVLNSFRKPDLVITTQSIRTIPDIIYAETDSFTLQIIIENIGMATNQQFIVEVTQTLPNGIIITKNIAVNGCLYKDTLETKLPIDIINGIGLNNICVYADIFNNINELNETNNNACISTIIRSGDLIPIYPYKYAIYPNSTVTLKASTGDPFSPQQTSIFQVDTNDYFVNPIAEINITHSGGVVEWTPPITLTDSTVYYWRVSKVPASGGNYNWKESSFIYIPNKFGWSQAHFFQFKNDNYNLIDYNRPYRKYDFVTTPKTLVCNNIGSPAVTDFFSIKYMLDGGGDYACCNGTPAIIVTVIDSLTLQPWESDKADYGHRDYPKCYSRNRNDLYFIFSIDSTSLVNLSNFIQSIPNGNYILAYTFREVPFQQWTSANYNIFEQIGASMISSIPDNYPYIFFCKKGNLSSVQEVIGSSLTDHITLSSSLSTNFNKGHINSEIIGPSTNWKSMHWRFNIIDVIDNDSVMLKLNGIKLDGTETVLIDSITRDSLDIYNLQNRLDATIYPYLNFNYYTQDDTTKTPAQINRWQLTYDGVAETAINPPKGYYFYQDTIQEGDNLIFTVSTENVSPYDMDSLLVSYHLKDKNGNIHHIKNKRLRKHPSGDIIQDTLSFNTTGYTGLNSIWIEFNPINSQTGYYDQLEQYHFNNIAEKHFYVTSDITNPLLDVTFDGVHIMDGDIVSAKPLIKIKLKDENKFLELNDTSLFAVYLTSLSTGEEKKIPFISSTTGNEIMLYSPAVMPDNSFEIEYNPIFNKDGKYQIRVQAQDKSSNESGANDYIITFEVINKSSITNIFNYPNPFSTATRFVFVLTGYEVPTDLRIQIMTVTGKLVREIGLNELGSIHIGRNITEYAWDGKDMFGDQLANGVYFYRVFAKINGKSIDNRETEADKFFKKGFGKMYLIR